MRRPLALACKIGLALGFLACTVNSYAEAPQPKATTVADTMSLPILTPSLSEMKTRKLRLENGLEAYLISDPGAKQSGAALAVEAGSWSEPDEYPGLAHFLEHMLFLGTEKYPNEQEYQAYITENGGMTNAYTAEDHTTYFFSIDNGAFDGALDRFAQFFIAPLFNPSGIDREMQAVDQEYAKNVEVDYWRELRIVMDLANQQHPGTRFRIGNLETLEGIPQDALKEWYATHYTAQRMHLAIYSIEPLDTLASMVANLFSAVPAPEVEEPSWDIPLFGEKLQGHTLFIDPIKDVRQLQLTWELPTEYLHMREAMPAEVVAFVLGHEGPGSLLANLKEKGWAERLSAGPVEKGQSNLFFSIRIDLTEQGLEDTYDVVEMCFEAIEMLKTQGIPRYIFDEIQTMTTLEYQYQSRQDPFYEVMHHARGMTREPLETYPLVSSIPQTYDPDAIRGVINELSPRTVLLVVSAKPARTGVTMDQQEKWMGGEYAIEKTRANWTERWAIARPSKGLGLPAPNPYMPKKLDLVVNVKHDEELEVPVPTLMAADDKSKVYYAADDRYFVPQIAWTFHLISPATETYNSHTAVLLDLYRKSVKEALTPTSYQAEMAGLYYTLKGDESGVSLNIRGFSDKAPQYLGDVLKVMKSVAPSEEQFAIFKESLGRTYANFETSQPIALAMEDVRAILRKEFVTSVERQKALPEVSYDEFNTFASSLYEALYTEAMLYGNLTQEQAQQVTSLQQQAFHASAYPEGQHRRPEILTLPAGQGPMFVVRETERQSNAAVLMLMDYDFSFEKQAALEILGAAIREPFSHELRTLQQTGYIVTSWSQELERQLGQFFAVQSNSHDGRDLLSRFELFIENFTRDLEKNIDEDKFRAVGQSLAINLEVPPENLLGMESLLDVLAFDYDGDFQWDVERVEAFRALSYEKFLEICREFLGPNNKNRLGILVEGKIPDDGTLQYTLVEDSDSLREMGSFSTRQSLSKTEPEPTEGEKT